MNEEQILEIPEEHVFMEFNLNEQDYVIFSNSVEPEEGDDVYFARITDLNGERVITSIQTEEEYNRVVAEFEKRLELLGDDEEDE